MSWSSKFYSSLTRKKILDKDILETPLARCLSTADLTLWGIGHMVGAGIYVLTGTIVKDIAGPGIVLSYLLAGFAAGLASMCYAEFGARVPKAGSAYTYTYVMMGEFWAFLIGWNIILEHILGVASVGRAWSASLDSLCDGAISNGTKEHVGEFHSSWLGEYPDFVALAIVIVIMILVMVGAKVSATFNNVFTVINITVLGLIIVAGIYYADLDNWTNKDRGGFLPYGFGGVVSGAASCFFAYIGFEGIAVAGEESKNPSRSIPIATVIAMMVVTVLYFTVSASLTLMVPYDMVDIGAPFPHAFAYHNLNWMKIAVAVGSLFGITCSLLGSVFSLPRAVYAMSADGLFFRSLANVNPVTQTPILSILIFSLLSGLLAFFVNLETLVEFMSIGTLSSFTVVAVSVLILRYQSVEELQFELKSENDTKVDDKEELLSVQSHKDIGMIKPKFRALPLLKLLSEHNISKVVIASNVLGMIATALVLVLCYEFIASAIWWAVLLVVVCSVFTILSFTLLLMHQVNTSFLTYQMPLVPWLPCLSIFLNVCLMLMLNPLTWLRMAIWLTIGFIIYFTYGIRNSTENRSMADHTQVISYNGDNKLSGKTMLHLQQPGLENDNDLHKQHSINKTESDDASKSD